MQSKLVHAAIEAIPATASATAPGIGRPMARAVTSGNASWPYAPCSRGISTVCYFTCASTVIFIVPR